MEGMFYQARDFNQDISNWNTSSVEEMGGTGFSDYGMFQEAESFNQNLSSWNVSSVTECGKFDLDATSWSLPRPNLPGSCLE
jgi:surface protein